MSETFVACEHCGVVFEKSRAVESPLCPVCEMGGPRRAVPRQGYAQKWWTELEDAPAAHLG